MKMLRRNNDDVPPRRSTLNLYLCLANVHVNCDHICTHLRPAPTMEDAQLRIAQLRTLFSVMRNLHQNF